MLKPDFKDDSTNMYCNFYRDERSNTYDLRHGLEPRASQKLAAAQRYFLRVVVAHVSNLLYTQFQLICSPEMLEPFPAPTKQSSSLARYFLLEELITIVENLLEHTHILCDST